MRHLLRAADLSDREIGGVLTRAHELATAAPPRTSAAVLGCLFLTSSMRTRVGFQVAAHRLGATAVSVEELRVDAKMSSAESYEDALRVLSGMVDIVVTRTPFPLTPEHLALVRSPVINGGDAVEHPTQAVIDLAAIREFRGDLRTLRVGLCGDLTMRSATSLLALLDRTPPRALRLVYPEGRAPVLPAAVAAVAQRAELSDCADLDVLVMVGLPPGTGPGHLDERARQPFVLTSELLGRLPADAVVLNPMPVIDEIAPDARHDHRVRLYEQSDHAVFVRMALLELLLRERRPARLAH